MAESTVRDGDKGIDLLKANIGQALQANRFLVQFTKLPGPMNGLQDEYLSILCSSSTLPGKSVGTNDHIRHRKMPDGDVDYGDTLSMTFLCDQNFLDRQIVEEWLRMIHTPLEANTNTLLNDGVEGERPEAQMFNFYNDYIGEAQLHVLRKDGTRALTYNIHECYVSSFDAIDLDMATENAPLTFSFDLTYRHFTTDYSNAMGDVSLSQPKEGNFELSGLNKGRRIFDAVLQGLKVAGRFNKKAGELGRKLGSFDTALSRASNIGRDLGVGSEYITNERRKKGGG